MAVHWRRNTAFCRDREAETTLVKNVETLKPGTLSRFNPVFSGPLTLLCLAKCLTVGYRGPLDIYRQKCGTKKKDLISLWVQNIE